MVKTDFVSVQKEITIADTDLNINIELFHVRFGLTINPSVVDAVINLLGHDEMYQPNILLRPGKYEVEVKQSGFRTVKTSIDIIDADVNVSVELVPLRFGLMINTLPEDADICFIDNDEPYFPGIQIKPGRYSVILTKPGFKYVETVIEIFDADIEVSIDLVPAVVAQSVVALENDVLLDDQLMPTDEVCQVEPQIIEDVDQLMPTDEICQVEPQIIEDVPPVFASASLSSEAGDLVVDEETVSIFGEMLVEEDVSNNVDVPPMFASTSLRVETCDLVVDEEAVLTNGKVLIEERVSNNVDDQDLTAAEIESITVKVLSEARVSNTTSNKFNQKSGAVNAFFGFSKVAAVLLVLVLSGIGGGLFHYTDSVAALEQKTHLPVMNRVNMETKDAAKTIAKKMTVVSANNNKTVQIQQLESEPMAALEKHVPSMPEQDHAPAIVVQTIASPLVLIATEQLALLVDPELKENDANAKVETLVSAAESKTLANIELEGGVDAKIAMLTNVDAMEISAAETQLSIGTEISETEKILPSTEAKVFAPETPVSAESEVSVVETPVSAESEVSVVETPASVESDMSTAETRASVEFEKSAAELNSSTDFEMSGAASNADDEWNEFAVGVAPAKITESESTTTPAVVDRQTPENIDQLVLVEPAVGMQLQLPAIEKPVVDRIAQLLMQAEINMQADRLMLPKGRNAWERYQAVLRLQPDNGIAKAGLLALVKRYLELAAMAIDRAQFSRARRFIDRAKDVGVGSDSVVMAAQDLEKAVALKANSNNCFGLDSSVTRESSQKIWQDQLTGIEFVWIPAGCFQMGSNDGDTDEKPVHPVLLTKGFWLARYELTQGQWEKVMGNNPSRFKHGKNHPVDSLSWEDSQQFIQKINSLSDKTFRLPTESEWEYACRSGGKHDEHFCGDNDLNRVAWFGEKFENGHHPVGSKAANRLGLYDMSGNVWEWVADAHAPYSKETVTNYVNTEQTSPMRVNRGGSWYQTAAYSRATLRNAFSPGFRDYGFGMRVVRQP